MVKKTFNYYNHPTINKLCKKLRPIDVFADYLSKGKHGKLFYMLGGSVFYDLSIVLPSNLLKPLENKNDDYLYFPKGSYVSNKINKDMTRVIDPVKVFIKDIYVEDIFRDDATSLQDKFLKYKYPVKFKNDDFKYQLLIEYFIEQLKIIADLKLLKSWSKFINLYLIFFSPHIYKSTDFHGLNLSQTENPIIFTYLLTKLIQLSFDRCPDEYKNNYYCIKVRNKQSSINKSKVISSIINKNQKKYGHINEKSFNRIFKQIEYFEAFHPIHPHFT